MVAWVSRPGSFEKLGGSINSITGVEMIDQNPIGNHHAPTRNGM